MNGYQFLIIDLTDVCRLETSAVELLAREARAKIEKRSLVFCGCSLDSEVYADLRRGGLELNFGAQSIRRFCIGIMREDPLGFELRDDAVAWCKSQSGFGNAENPRSSTDFQEEDGQLNTTNYYAFSQLNTPTAQVIDSEEDAVRGFRELFGNRQLFHEFLSPIFGWPVSDTVTQLKARGKHQVIPAWRADESARSVIINPKDRDVTY